MTLLLSTSAHADVFKCKDSNGKTIYSDKPCEYGAKPLNITESSFGGNSNDNFESERMPRSDKSNGRAGALKKARDPRIEEELHKVEERQQTLLDKRRSLSGQLVSRFTMEHWDREQAAIDEQKRFLLQH